MKIINFRGELTDSSAKKEALFGTPLSGPVHVQCDKTSAIALMMNHDSITVLPLSIQTLCERHRHVVSPNDIAFSIRRLHSKHLDRAHAVLWYQLIYQVILHPSLNQC